MVPVSPFPGRWRIILALRPPASSQKLPYRGVPWEWMDHLTPASSAWNSLPRPITAPAGCPGVACRRRWACKTLLPGIRYDLADARKTYVSYESILADA